MTPHQSIPSQPFLLIPLLLLTPQAHAQDPPQEPLDVHVQGTPADPKAPTSWRTPLSLTRAQLLGADLSDALEDAPGVHVRRFGADGARAELTLRGASPGQVAVLWGGLTLNPARGGGADLGLLPPALLHSATLHRGPAGARWGSGALGGALVLEPRLPDQPHLQASLGAASFGTYRLQASAAGPLWPTSDDPDDAIPLAGLFAVEGLTTDADFRFQDDQDTLQTRVGAQAQRLGLASALAWNPTPRLELSLQHLTTLSDRGASPPSEFQQALSDATLSDQRHALLTRAQARDLAQGPTWNLDADLSLAWRADASDYLNPTPLLRAQRPFQTQLDEQALRTTAALSLYIGDDTTAALTAEAGPDLLTRAASTPSEPDQAPQDLHRWNASLALFAEHLWRFAPPDPDTDPTTELSTSLALRADQVGPHRALIPSLGLALHLPADLTLQSNLGASWRAPSLDELYLQQEFIEGDPDLRPERALSADLGARWTPAPKTSIEFVAFWLDIQDLILFLPVSPSLFRATNTGSATSRGLELSLSAQPWRWLRLQGGWTWTDARLDLPPQDPLPGRPAHDLWAELALSQPDWELFARWRARDRLPLDNYGSLYDQPAQWLDLGFLGHAGGGWRVGLTVRNLLDERGAQDALQTPLPGTSLHGQLSWTLTPDEP